MKKNKAYKYRLYPNKEQTVLIEKTIGCTRFIYNKMLSDKINHYKDTKLMLKNYPSQYKNEFEFLKEIDSLALANAQLNLNSAYTNFFTKAKKQKPTLRKSIKKKLKEGTLTREIRITDLENHPQFKSKKYSSWSYTTNNQKGTIQIKDNKVKVPKIGFIKLKLHRNIPEDSVIKGATVSKTKTNKYYISILVEYENQVLQKDIEKVIGLDFSMKELYVDSNGNSANFPRFYRKAQEKLAKEQRILSHRKYESKRYEKQKLKVAKVHERIANQRKDFLHKESKKLSDNFDLVCIEDLNMKAMSQCLNFGKSVSDNGWGFFTTILKYKLEDQGKYLYKIDKWFPSSKMCHVCGKINEKLTLEDREWDCECKAHLVRDHNAAINIRTVGMTGIAQVCLCH